MPTRSDHVKSAIAVCDFRYMCLNYNIRTLTERIEGLWHEVERHLDLMEAAEEQGNEGETLRHLEQIVYNTLRIQEEVRALNIRA